MRLIDKEHRRLCLETLREVRTDADTLDVARRAIAEDDGVAIAWMLLGTALRERGELAEAEAAFWRAARLAPCQPLNYFQLSDIMKERGEDPATAFYLSTLSLRCVASAERVPDEIATAFSTPSMAEKIDFKDPRVYELLADTLEESPPEGVPAGMPDSLVPFDLLLRLCILAPEEVDPELLARIRATPECVPVFHAALRQWFLHAGSLGDAALAMVVAVLGEMGGPEVADDVAECCSINEDQLFAHANWALWRMGQRLPAETLEVIVAATPEAPVSLRCAFAEQLALLPSTVNAEAALRGLLADSPSGEDVAYLVLAVSDALARRGHRSASRSVYTEGLKSLDEAGRKWAQERVRKRDFTPRLIEEDIHGYTLEEVCLERLMMDDDEDEEADDEDEPAKDLPPAVRPGRNDPCWCGSGKKYKKCHLASDQPLEAMPDRQRLLLEVVDGAHRWHTQADIEAAKEMYFGPYQAHELTEEDALPFFEWLIRDFRSRSSGKTAVEEFLRRRGHELTAIERRMLEAWRDSRFGLFEVQRVDEGKGVELKEHFTGDLFFVHDVAASKDLVKWDCTLSRIESIAGRWEFSGVGLLVPRPALPTLLEFIEKERGPDRSPSEFVNTNSHRVGREVRELFEGSQAGPQLANTDGEPLEFSNSSYQVLDEAALLAALRATGGLTEHEPGREFVWVGQAGLGPETSLGRIQIAGGKLKLECNSRQRLARGKKLIEQAAGKSLRYLRDNFESMASARARLKDAPAAPESKLDPEVGREVIQKFQEEHYRTWPDVPLPALGGLTPRAAMATASGRASVLNLVRMFENGEERARKTGRPAFDFSALRADLGLPPE